MTDAAFEPYRVDVPLRWSDMDAYGHVNNVQFLRLLEEARVEGFRDWFGQERDVLGTGVLVARSEIDYLAPLTFRHAPARILMWCTKISGASFELAYVVTDPEGVGETIYARAASTMVLYDFEAASPTRLDAPLREKLREHLGPAVPLKGSR